MQILPQQLATADSTSSGTISRQAVQAAKQTALFASLLSGMASASTSDSPAPNVAATSSASASTVVDPLEAAKAPSREELMSLPLTREDISALHDELTTRGFSETEIADMQARTDSSQGMTWGDLMHEVKKKVSTSESTKKEQPSTSDQAQLLGLFGKLGFTGDEAQQLVDSLAKGETEAVWNKVKAKVADLSADTTVSLDSSEIAALGQSLNLSQNALNRLTTLFEQSTASQGLSAQGLASAVSVIQNEITGQLAQESQSLEGFKQAAASVLAQAWQKSSAKKHSDLHEDDVARKAAQAVSMGGTKGGDNEAGATAKPIVQAKVDVTADLPETGVKAQADQAKGQGEQTAGAKVAEAKTAGDPQASLREAGGHDTSASGTVEAKVGDRAGQLQAEGKTSVAQEQAKTTGLTETVGEASTAKQGQEKVAANTSRDSGLPSFGGAGGNAAGGHSDQFGQSAKDGQGNWGEFWSKVRSEGVATETGGGTATARQQSLGQSVGTAAEGAFGRFVKTAATQANDPGLASRAARQLETGILRDLGQGAKQLTLTLNPDELGKLSVTLTVKDKEVRATITADNPDTAAMLQDQAAKIKQTLEGQGLKVAKLDVQTSLAQDNQSAWQGPEQHNMAREQRETMERMRSSIRLARSMNGTSAEAEPVSVIPGALTSQGAGLDLFT
jgi:flagellar hook-length control protein FliK